MRKHIELASQARLKSVAHLAPRFFREVVGYEYSDCLVTDESDLRDFAACDAADAGVADMLDRLQAHYFLDARLPGSTRIVDLLEYLESRGAEP